MNFGKLLAAGKSIINGRRVAAYRENPHVYLPKFEPVKNPFVKGAPPAAAPAPVAPAAPVKSAPARLVAPLAESPFRPAAPAPAAIPAKRNDWAARLNPISIFRGAPAPAPAVVAVQTELSLDTVKVVDNDLSDSEVEVVPIKSRPARTAGQAAAEAAETWNDLGAKAFGANAI